MKKTFEPSQVLQEAWQAKQVPAPEYMPGMHSLLRTKIQNTFSEIQVSKYNMFEKEAPGLGWEAVAACFRIPIIPSMRGFYIYTIAIVIKFMKDFSFKIYK